MSVGGKGGPLAEDVDEAAVVEAVVEAGVGVDERADGGEVLDQGRVDG